MTNFRIESGPFVGAQLEARGSGDARFRNWPVVYTLDGDGHVYVGESRNAIARLRQHPATVNKRDLRGARVVLDETFNKSVCPDLESYLIRLLAGDGRLTVLNRNESQTNADYYARGLPEGVHRHLRCAA
ncbi:GIY-YIG nuclease family protein [Nocardioides sp. B-3]|uniref:GIY-YIG nuclease family protein n=1 Tax=Nocardioides sp. B-3 TaxID=2895565 RepID=UPI002152F801|nr:GIY-YIG nuclease family protein [Nocardioides sp. B-3]UUZ59458.1 hypothetical protein LP418_27365 [Nocardioides sp. B-3]